MEVILILVKLLQKHYDFKAYLGKHEISTRTSYRIVIPDRYREQFFAIVQPFFIDCNLMALKLRHTSFKVLYVTVINRML
jgi:hypothetical protein